MRLATRHPTYVTLGTILISLLVLIKHRPNIARLIAGEETRLNFGGRDRKDDE